MAKPDRITKLSSTIKRREKESKHALAQLDRFSRLFYNAIEDTLSALVFKGVESVAKPKRKKTDGSQQSFSFAWSGYQFVCMPCPGAALPPPEEADLLGELAHRLAGRLVMYAYSMGAPDSQVSVNDYYVFPDGSWCVCGLQRAAYADLKAKEISRYALRLLSDLESEFALFWRPGHELWFGENDRAHHMLVKHPTSSGD